MKKNILIAGGLLLLLGMAACVVVPAPGYYPGPYVARPAVYGGGYYYHRGYGYYR